MSSNGWGIGLAAGAVQHPASQPGPNALGNTFAYIPYFVSFRDDRVVMQANLGWQRDRATGRDNMTWGIGGEFYTGPRLALIAETFGDDRALPYWQTGIRFVIIPNLFQLDATVGQQFHGDGAGRWLSFGLRWTPDRLF